MADLTGMLQAAAGAGGGSEYWIALLGGSGEDYGSGVAIDSQNNIVICGYTASDGAGGNDVLVAKFNEFGELQWAKTLGGVGSELAYDVAIDSSDNIIIAASTTSAGVANAESLLIKYNSSGVLQWDNVLGDAQTDNFYGVAIDSSNNIVVCGTTNSDGAGSFDLLVAKYNSSGVLQWDKTLGGGSNDFGVSIAIDSSDNIIISGRTASDGVGSDDCLVAKYNSSGTLQWDRTLGASNIDRFSGVAVDSSDNIIAVGQALPDSGGAGGYDLLVAKYNSSGTLQWQRFLGGASNDIAYSVVTDASGNIFVAGFTDSSGQGGADVLIASYDASGTLQWQRTLGYSSNEYADTIKLDNNGNIVICGYTASDGAGGNDAIIVKLPSDGSLTGTYGNFVYASCALTSSSGTLTDAAAVLTDAAAVLTTGAAGLTDDTAVLTDELIPIT